MHTHCAERGCYMFAEGTPERDLCTRACRLQLHGLVRAADDTSTALAPATSILSTDERSLLQSLVSATKSPGTRRKYLSAWRGFERWAAARGEAAPQPPVDPELVLAYVLHRAPTTSPSALAVDLAAISAVHVAFGTSTPKHPQLRDVLAGHRRTWDGSTSTKSKGKAAALRAPALRQVVEACETTPRGLRDRAILLVGFAGALRRSEIGAIQVQDIRFEPEGVTLRLPRSKTDQEGRGQSVAILPAQPGSDAPCPVAALRAWLAVRGSAPGPLWARFQGGPNPNPAIVPTRLTGETVGNIVHDRTRAAGLDASHVSGHSLRRGWITEAAAGGAHERDIRKQSRHRDVATFEGYIEDASVLSRTPKVL